MTDTPIKATDLGHAHLRVSSLALAAPSDIEEAIAIEQLTPRGGARRASTPSSLIDRASARCLIALGDAAAHTGDLGLAMGSYARALEMLTGTPTPEGLAYVQALADAHRQADRSSSHDAALAILLAAVEMGERP